MPWGILQGLIGGDQQGQAAQQNDAQGQAHMQAQGYNGLAAQLGNLRHQQVIHNIDGIVQYQGHPLHQAAIGNQQAFGVRRRDGIESLESFTLDWMNEGFEVRTIVVSKATFHSLYLRLAAMRAYMANEGPQEIPKELTVNTAMGPIKITCEQKMSFNLERYMETI